MEQESSLLSGVSLPVDTGPRHHAVGVDKEVCLLEAWGQMPGGPDRSCVVPGSWSGVTPGPTISLGLSDSPDGPPNPEGLHLRKLLSYAESGWVILSLAFIVESTR